MISGGLAVLEFVRMRGGGTRSGAQCENDGVERRRFGPDLLPSPVRTRTLVYPSRLQVRLPARWASGSTISMV